MILSWLGEYVDNGGNVIMEYVVNGGEVIACLIDKFGIGATVTVGLGWWYEDEKSWNGDKNVLWDELVDNDFEVFCNGLEYVGSVKVTSNMSDTDKLVSGEGESTVKDETESDAIFFCRETLNLSFFSSSLRSSARFNPTLKLIVSYYTKIIFQEPLLLWVLLRESHLGNQLYIIYLVDFIFLIKG